MYEIDINNLSPEVRLYLCRPDRTVISELKNITNRNLKIIFGGINQLSFEVPYKIMKHSKMTRNPLVDLVRGDYLVKVERENYKDYFIISNPEYNSENGIEKLLVNCNQLQYEWKDKLVRLFKGTKLLYNPVGSEGVLNETLLQKTDWSISAYDSELTNRYRTFDESEKNLMEFVYSSLERYGDFVPVVNTEMKQVSIQKTVNVGLDRGTSITAGKYLKSLNYVENFEDVVTRLYVYGRSGISINSVSMSGLDYIEDLSFYIYGYEEDEHGNVISSSPYMSDGLCHALIQYNNLLESKSGTYNSLLTQRDGYTSTLITKQGELVDLNSELKTFLDTKDTLIATGGNLTTINAQIVAKNGQITSKQSEISAVKSNIATVDANIATLRTQISIDSNFTPDQIKERQKFIKERTWSDESYTEPIDLYEEGKERLKRMSQPIVSYTADSIDFLSALNTQMDWDKLRIGEIVTITYPNFGIDVKCMIVEFDWSIDSKTLKLTIANHRDIKTGFLKFKDLVNRSVQTSTQVDMSKYKWDLSEANNTDINRIMNNKWDATKQAVVAGKNENVIVNERGITLNNLIDDTKILRLLSSTIAMSKDGGNSYRTAITADGVVAESVYGVLLAGTNLTIQNSAGTVLIDSQGMSITNMDLTITTTSVKSRIKLNGTEGIKIDKNTGTTSSPVWSTQFSVDSNGDALFGGNIAVGSGTSVFKVDSNGMYLGHNTFSSAPFRVTPTGALTATNVIISGGQMGWGSWSINSAGVLTATGANISGNVTANAIVAGSSISSPTIIGGSIYGTTLMSVNANRNITISGNSLVAYDSAGKRRISINDSGVAGDCSLAFFREDGNTLSAYMYQASNTLRIVASSDTIRFAGSINFSEASVTGLSVSAVFA